MYRCVSILVFLVLIFSLSSPHSFVVAQDGDDNILVIPNVGDNILEGHTPLGLETVGDGLFVGDNLNPVFPNGDGVYAFITFDLSDLPPNADIASAILSSDHIHRLGRPLEDLGPLIVEEIRYDAFSSALRDAPVVEDGFTCVLATTFEGEFACDVAPAIAASQADGYPYVQFRLRLETISDQDGEGDVLAFFTESPNQNMPGLLTITVTFSNAAVTEAFDFDKGLVAYYPFDGDADDFSGHDHHGEINDATFTEDRFGNADAAIQFDGETAYIEIADADALDIDESLTLSLWLFFEPQADENAYYTLLEKSDPGDGHSRYGAWIIGDRVEVCVEPERNDTQRCLDSTEPLLESDWNHIVGVYDGANLSVYVNGEVAGTVEGSPVGISQNDAPIFIGTDLFQPQVLYIQAILDDVRLYNRALSADEVLALFEHE